MGYKPLSGKYLDHQTFHDLLMFKPNLENVEALLKIAVTKI